MVSFMTFKKIAALIAATLLAILALGTPAHADTVPIKAGTAALCGPECQKAAAAPENCRYNSSVCGYESAFYNCDDGCEVIPFSSAGHCDAVALSRQWSSYWNNSGRTSRVYKSTNCTGDYLTYYSSTGESYFLTSGHTSWENAVRSVRLL